MDHQIQQLAGFRLKLQLLDVCSHVIPFNGETFDYSYPGNDSDRVIDQRSEQLVVRIFVAAARRGTVRAHQQVGKR